VTRAAVWRDDFTLTTTDVATSAQSASANANAADQLTLRARETRDPAERDRLVARAVSHLEKALRIHPRYQRAWAILATTQRELRGDLDATLDVYERRFAVDPRGHDAAFNLGTLLLDRRPARRAEAIGYLELAAELRPDDPDPLANLAVGYYRAGETRQAIATLERALRLAPSRLDLHRNLAELLREIGDDAKLEREREAIDALEARVAPGA
jgi:Tfp pilus assembly protein PilF